MYYMMHVACALLTDYDVVPLWPHAEPDSDRMCAYRFPHTCVRCAVPRST